MMLDGVCENLMAAGGIGMGCKRRTYELGKKIVPFAIFIFTESVSSTHAINTNPIGDDSEDLDIRSRRSLVGALTVNTSTLRGNIVSSSVARDLQSPLNRASECGIHTRLPTLNCQM